MTDKFRVVECLGGGEPIVTICCLKADWVEMVKARAELADRDNHIEHLNFQLGEACLKIAEYEHQPLAEVKAWSDGLKQGVVDQLAARDAKIADMREILQDVLSDCCLSDGMRSEIEKRISGKESG